MSPRTEPGAAPRVDNVSGSSSTDVGSRAVPGAMFGALRASGAEQAASGARRRPTSQLGPPDSSRRTSEEGREESRTLILLVSTHCTGRVQGADCAPSTPLG